MLVLIASLGRSPGVVTGTVDALINEKKKPRRVYIATTGDPLIWERCIPLLKQEFEKNYPDIELLADRIYTRRDDIYDETDNAEFIRKTAAVVGREKRVGNDVYMSVAGGRKTMSAAMALIGQLYGVKAILHLLIDPELEADGVITKLLQLSEERKRLVLHPPVNKYRLIEFPIFAIPWMIEEIIEALEKGESKNNYLDKIVKDMSENTRKMLKNTLKEAEELSKKL